MKRRKFISVTGAAALAIPVIGAAACASETVRFNGHKFPELNFGYNALEPYIDAKTMELHYSKHHKGYFNKFLAAAEGTELIDTPMPQIFEKVSEHPEAVRNNGGGFYNHTLLWENMTPHKSKIPSDLMKGIENDFGSFDTFKEQFATAAKIHFGSGWAWLAADNNGKLFVSSTSNQDNPLMNVAEKNGTPLLALDVWEHAYYLKYQNMRADYVDNFWNVINWDVVHRRYKNALA